MSETEVTALKAEIGELKSKVEELESANHDQEVAQITRRGRKRKWPWMPELAYKIKKPTVKALPKALWGHVAQFLTSQEKFELRGTNSSFYQAFVDEKVVRGEQVSEYPHFDNERAVLLASKGRVFKNVQHLDLSPLIYLGHNEQETLIAPKFAKGNFPALRSLRNTDSYLPLLAGFPVLHKLESYEGVAADTQKKLLSKKLPNLERLSLYPAEEGMLQLHPHPNLKSVRFEIDERDKRPWPRFSDLNQVNRRRFPALETVEIAEGQLEIGEGDGVLQTQNQLLRETLAEEGIKLISYKPSHSAYCTGFQPGLGIFPEDLDEDFEPDSGDEEEDVVLPLLALNSSDDEEEEALEVPLPLLHADEVLGDVED